MSWARGLPLHARDGSVRAFAMVDLEDYEQLAGLPWSIDNRFTRYVAYKHRGKAYFLHRVVLGLLRDDSRRVDHINRDPLDCRKANLRIATAAENAQNQGSRGGTSRYRGVAWDRSREKWLASATLNGRRTTIGRFETEDEAGEAAARWRRQYMPFSEEAAVREMGA